MVFGGPFSCITEVGLSHSPVICHSGFHRPSWAASLLMGLEPQGYFSSRFQEAKSSQWFSGTNCFPLFLGGCPTKMVQGPKKGSLFFPGSLNNLLQTFVAVAPRHPASSPKVWFPLEGWFAGLDLSSLSSLWLASLVNTNGGLKKIAHLVFGLGFGATR